MATTREVFEHNLRTVESKNVDAAVAVFAPDAVLADPHYPFPRMQGHDEIRDGLVWAFDGMRSFSFQPTSVVESDGTLMAEVRSHHVMTNGRSLDFTQVFVVEVSDGLVTRWEAYEPYGPNGIAGFFLGLSKRQHRRRRKAR